MKIAIFTALKEERRAVRLAWPAQPVGSLKGTELEADDQAVSVCTGVGPHRMTDCVERVRSIFEPELLVLLGYSAGLKPQMKVGDLVVDARSDSHLLERLTQLHPRMRVAPIASSGFLNSAQQKAAFAAEVPDSLVADLESEAFLEAAQGVPCLVVRAVSDTVDSDLPLDFENYLTPLGFPSELAIAKAVLARPGIIGQMLALARDSAKATNALARVLSNIRPVLLSRLRNSV